MAVTITGSYLGNKKMALTHEPSGAVIHTAAPLDNNGDGSSFSPTDLVAAALGACMTTVMSIVADRDQIDLSGAHFRVEKHMSQSPRRIGNLPLQIHLPQHLTIEQREKLERAARTCPVHHSLHPDVQHDVEFLYDVVAK